MNTQHTYLVLDGLLGENSIRKIAELSATAPYLDGRATARAAAKDVKQNLQMNQESRQYLEIQQLLLGAMNSSSVFRNAVLPLHVYPFLLGKYQAGMKYGWHVDSPIMGNMMRTDVAMTIFLNDPEAYDGGELELQTPSGSKLYKLPAGSAVCYPCTQLHRVRDVVRGQRQVAVTWIQSLVRSAEQRKILFDLQEVADRLRALEGRDDEVGILQQSHSNIMRMWSH